MTRTKSTYLALMAALLSPMAASADPITFNWTANNTNSVLLSGSGSWTLDDSFLVPGFADYTGVITAFQFDWNTSGGSFSVNSGTGSLFLGGMAFDPLLNLISFNLCASANAGCSISQAPVIQVTNAFWIACGTVSLCGSVNGPETATETPTVRVPEPGTLALLGIGLFGMRLARRNKKA